MGDISIVERYGILGFVAWGLVYGCRWIATEIVKPLVKSHTDLVDQLKISDARATEVGERQEATLTSQERTLELHANTLERFGQTLDRLAQSQQEICEILKALKEK